MSHTWTFRVPGAKCRGVWWHMHLLIILFSFPLAWNEDAPDSFPSLRSHSLFWIVATSQPFENCTLKKCFVGVMLGDIFLFFLAPSGCETVGCSSELIADNGGPASKDGKNGKACWSLDDVYIYIYIYISIETLSNSKSCRFVTHWPSWNAQFVAILAALDGFPSWALLDVMMVVWDEIRTLFIRNSLHIRSILSKQHGCTAWTKRST